MSATMGRAFTGVTPGVLQWQNRALPLPPQAFDRRAGDPEYQGQQAALSKWIAALDGDYRHGHLPRGLYRLSGAEQITKVVGNAISIQGDGRGRSIIWADDTFTGVMLHFEDIWWASDQSRAPSGVVPSPGQYAANNWSYQLNQAWQGRLALRDFSLVGSIVNRATGAIAAPRQHGIQFTDRIDHAQLIGLDLLNMAGSGIRQVTGPGLGAAGLRECQVERLMFRHCGWGQEFPAFDLNFTGTGGSQGNYYRIRGSEWANCHGTHIRIRNEGNGSAGATRIIDFLDLTSHGESSWNPAGAGYDASIPLPGGSRWHLIDILGHVDTVHFRGVRTTHSLDGHFIYHIGAVNGKTPFEIFITESFNEGAGTNLLWVEHGYEIVADFYETAGGLIRVGSGVTGAVTLRGPAHDKLNVDIAEPVRHLVSMAGSSPRTNLPLRVAHVDSRHARSEGSALTIGRASVLQYARTLGTGATTNFAFTDDSLVGQNVIAGTQAGEAIRLEAGTMALIAYHVLAIGVTTIRAEWRGVVLAHRLTNAASLTIIGGAGASIPPDTSDTAPGASARLAIAADTVQGGVQFTATQASTINWHLRAEVITIGQVVAGNLGVAQALLEQAAAGPIAELATSRVRGFFADDAAAGAAGVTSGQRFILATGKLAVKT
jgi:hypothetical protein